MASDRDVKRPPWYAPAWAVALFEYEKSKGEPREDRVRRMAGIPLVSECGHARSTGPYCSWCGVRLSQFWRQ